jgi:hypothetical protein
LATIAIIYGAFATMVQKDLKHLNAYSSVSHCGFVLPGIGMLTKTSINGAVLQRVSHGLMKALFFAAIGMIYSRPHTRLVAQLGSCCGKDPEEGASLPPALPPTAGFTVGVTDVTFNPVNALLGRSLKTKDGYVVILGFWQRKKSVSHDEVPCFERKPY